MISLNIKWHLGRLPDRARVAEGRRVDGPAGGQHRGKNRHGRRH